MSFNTFRLFISKNLFSIFVPVITLSPYDDAKMLLISIIANQTVLKIILFSIINIMTINERFAEILKSKNISVKDTASLIGKSEVYVRKLMRAGESFGIEPVLLILNSIEDVNPDWLLREKGTMFRKQSEMEESSPITNERLLSIIESQQRTIENLSNSLHHQ